MVTRKLNLFTNSLCAKDRHWRHLSLETCSLNRNYSYALRDDGGISKIIASVWDVGVPGTPSSVTIIGTLTHMGMLTPGHFRRFNTDKNKATHFLQLLGNQGVTQKEKGSKETRKRAWKGCSFIKSPGDQGKTGAFFQGAEFSGIMDSQQGA